LPPGSMKPILKGIGESSTLLLWLKWLRAGEKMEGARVSGVLGWLLP